MYKSQTLTVSQLSFQYPHCELTLSEHTLVHNISFTLLSASMLHIQGSNGSGKTSLLKLLAGLFRPDEGEIRYGEHDIWSNMPAYQQQIQYVGHKNGFNPDLTVWEHAILDWPVAPNPEMLMQTLTDLALAPLKDRPCHLLSAGQKRRVALLRLFLSPASVWLLDEPLVALDQQGITFLMTRLQHHIAQGGQVIYTSHQPLPWQAAAHQDFML